MGLIIIISDFYSKHRTIIILMAILIGTICTMNVEFNNSEINAHWYTALYHTLQFFLLNAAFPIAGEWYFFYPLLIIYFLIPLATVEFIGSLFIELFHSFTFRHINFRKLKNHVVIAGLGETGEFLSHKFVEGKQNVVLAIDNSEEVLKRNVFIDKNIKCFLADIGKQVDEIDYPGIKNDQIEGISLAEKKNLSNSSFIAKTNIKDAELFFALTGKDFVNLNAAYLLNEELQNDRETPHCFIQISDSFLLQTIRVREKTNPVFEKNKIHFINKYQIVAKKVVDDLFLEKTLTENKEKTLFVIAGFGRFGKMIFEQIIDSNRKNEDYDICIIDNDKDKEDDIFFSANSIKDLTPGFHDNPLDKSCRYEYKESDIRKIETWENLFIDNQDKKIIPIIATDNDTNNLSAAIRIQNIVENHKEKYKQQQEIKIVCRFFKNPLVLLGEKDRFTAWCFSDILHEELEKTINLYRK